MDEIEEFLRRAAARQHQQAAQQPEIQYVEPEIIEAQSVDEKPISSVQQRHLETSGFDQRAAQLGRKTAKAHDRMEARVQQRLDHQVSHLPESSPGPEDTRAYENQDETPYLDDEPHVNRAKDLAQLMRSPRSIRQAIILSEILRRPGQHR